MLLLKANERRNPIPEVIQFNVDVVSNTWEFRFGPGCMYV